jgi:hypothetical protein
MTEQRNITTRSVGSRRPDGQKRLCFIGCEIVTREICHLVARCRHAVDLQFLRKGLHDLETDEMRSRVQATIDAVDPADYDAILLGYARCNDGLVGVVSQNLPLVIPKAHDCITFFLGSRAAYREEFDAHPGTYYMTTGWCERNGFEEGQYATPAYGQTGVMGKLGLADSFDQLVDKYGEDNARHIWQTLGDWRQQYSRMLYLRMHTCQEAPFIEKASAEAIANGWAFEVRDGCWDLLEDLLDGDWDDRYLVVRPGEEITARNDEEVLGCRRCSSSDSASGASER